jgi:hypothetical protein
MRSKERNFPTGKLQDEEVDTVLVDESSRNGKEARALPKTIKLTRSTDQTKDTVYIPHPI